MLKYNILLFVYFLFSILNLSLLREAAHESLPSFMVSRGFVGIFLSLLVYRVSSQTFRFPILKHTRNRITYGGVGMTLQILGASQIPIAIYALLNRATPVWFSMLVKQKAEAFSLAMIATVMITPFIFQSFTQALFIGVGAMVVGTFLVAFSQKSQMDGAALESRWLMPFAPAFGISVIGLVMILVTSAGLHLSLLGLISGLVMTLAYWIAQPVIVGSKNGGLWIVLGDLTASVVLGLGEALKQSSGVSLVYIGLTLLIFLMFSRMQRRVN